MTTATDQLGAPSRTAGRILFLACSTLDPSADEADRALFVEAKPEDWAQVKRLALQSGLAGHVARGLALAGPADPETLETLAARSRARHALQVSRRPAAAEAITTLEAAGCEPILLKGYALAEEIYGALAARGFGDVDILVPKARFADAVEALKALGYDYRHPGCDGDQDGEHAVELVRADGSRIDLHWKLADGFPPSAEALIASTAQAPSGPGRLGGKRLAPAIMLLHLADHYCHHDFESIKPLIDFYVCADRLAGEIDPAALQRLAADLGLADILDLTLMVCRRHLRPSPAIDRLLRPRPSRRAVRAAARLDARLVLQASATPIARWRAAFTRRLATQNLVQVAAWMRPWLAPDRYCLAERFGETPRWSHYPRYYALQTLRVATRSPRRFNEFLP